MTITTKIPAFAGATALAITALTGVQVVSPAPAAAASCSTSVPGWWSVTNKTCKLARHFNIVGSVTKTAPWVGKTLTSYQPVCWAGASRYGVEVKF